MASPVIADPFHRMKYMERHGNGLRKIVRETEKPPGYTAAYNPKIFSTATDFRVILKNANYQLSQKNLSIPIEISILFGNSEHPFPERKNMPFRSRVQPFI